MSTGVKDIQHLPCFNEIDRQLASFLARITEDSSDPFMLAALLTSRAIEAGDTCVPLQETAGKKLGDLFDETVFSENSDAAGFKLPPLKSWIKALKSNSAVGSPGEDALPLILDGANRLYLYRYFNYEATVAGKVITLAGEPDPGYKIPEESIRRLFPCDESSGPDMQKEAALLSLRRKLCVISGGPGTGKTSTVVKILALLAEQALSEGQTFRPLLAAPTGKAAARLRESILNSLDNPEIPPRLKDMIPVEASTIHRLLSRRSRRDDFEDGPSYIDCTTLVVDESSMMDIRTAAELFTAVDPRAGIILLGDRYQLSSVEAGAVFASICGDTGKGNRSMKISSESPVVFLNKSWRFTGDHPIGIAAEAVKTGDPDRLLSLIGGNRGPVRLIEPEGAAGVSPELKRLIPLKFADLFTGAGPLDALESMKKFALLCALRRGPAGVEGINMTVEKILAEEKVIPPAFKTGSLYTGMPVIVTSNDYNLGLYNGDTGIIFKNEKAGAFYAAFPDSESGSFRDFPVLMLPPHEKVYAMTVHKSQGSEFNDIAFILPERPSPVLTRELIYTAITRAKNSVTIFGSPETLTAGIANPTVRRSGLMDAVYGSDSSVSS